MQLYRGLVRWACALFIVSVPCLAADDLSNATRPELSSEQTEEIEDSIARALAWLAGQQKTNASFPTDGVGEPAVTSFCLLTILAGGHLPGEGPYGKVLDRGIHFVVRCQRPDGLLSLLPPGPVHRARQPSHTAIYNHAFSGVLLSEVCGMIPEDREFGIRPVIKQELAFTRAQQTKPKRYELDHGGWRYLRQHQDFVVLSVSLH